VKGKTAFSLFVNVCPETVLVNERFYIKLKQEMPFSSPKPAPSAAQPKRFNAREPYMQ
jgi:hypothetical protein